MRGKDEGGEGGGRVFLHSPEPKSSHRSTHNNGSNSLQNCPNNQQVYCQLNNKHVYCKFYSQSVALSFSPLLLPSLSAYPPSSFIPQAFSHSPPPPHPSIPLSLAHPSPHIPHTSPLPLPHPSPSPPSPSPSYPAG